MSSVLTAVYNVVALNLLFVVTSLPLVTLPITIGAGLDGLYRWRYRGEDGAVSAFVRGLATRPGPRWVTMAPGVAAVVLGGIEVAYFLQYTGFIAVLCMSIGLVTAGIGVSVTVFSGLFMALSPGSSSRDTWRFAAAIGARRVWTTLPLMLAITIAGVGLGIVDPPFVVVFVPVLVLWAWLAVAVRAARREGVLAAGEERRLES